MYMYMYEQAITLLATCGNIVIITTLWTSQGIQTD